MIFFRGGGVKSFMQRSNLRKVADSTEEYLNRFRRPFPVLSRIINYWKEIIFEIVVHCII